MIHFGIVEDRSTDPLMIGRCKVRVFGVHSDDKTLLPTEDLPWATPLQSITSAATDGIGHAPVGLINGSWVAVTFADEHQQIPIILGSIAGFKPDSASPQATIEPVVTTSDGSILLDGQGQPVHQGEYTSIQTGDTESTIKTGAGVTLFDPSSLSLSAEGAAELKKSEGLSSTSSSSNSPTTLLRLIKQYGTNLADVKFYSYKDSIGYAIGYGSRFLADGTAVTKTTILTYPEIEILFDIKIKNEFEAGLKRNLKVKVTQSMFDALISLAYNAGVSGLVNSNVFRALNRGYYTLAANYIINFKNSSGSAGVTARRLSEQNLFVRDGLPETKEESEEYTDITTPEVLANKPESAPVLSRGAKADGKSTVTYSGESDINRLARNRKYSSTAKAKDDNQRKKNVMSADGTFWSQPESAYGTEYPHNNIFVSESGHIQEFDDTAGYERISTRHTKGTFHEIDANGTQVTRIVGDSYTIIDRHGFISIDGNCNITINGNANLNILNNANISVSGDMKTTVGGSADVIASGSLTLGSNKSISIHSSGVVAIQGKEIHLNSKGKIKAPTYKALNRSGDPAFAPLVAQSIKGAEVNSTFETPEEGDNSTYVETNIHKMDISDMAPNTGETKEEVTPQVQSGSPVTTICELLEDSQIVSSYKLTDRITLGRLLERGSSGYPRGMNYGLKGHQIVCNLKKLSLNCLDPILDEYTNLIVTSAWRSQSINTKIKGSTTSDHLFGRAVDIQIPGAKREDYLQIANTIASKVKNFKQIILEYRGGSTWIHISYDENNNKKQILTMDASINKTIASGKFIRLG